MKLSLFCLIDLVDLIDPSTAIDFQQFLGMYRRLFSQCRSVVRLSFWFFSDHILRVNVKHLEYKSQKMLFRDSRVSRGLIFVQVLQDSDMGVAHSQLPEQKVSPPPLSKVRLLRHLTGQRSFRFTSSPCL